MSEMHWENIFPHIWAGFYSSRLPWLWEWEQHESFIRRQSSHLPPHPPLFHLLPRPHLRLPPLMSHPAHPSGRHTLCRSTQTGNSPWIWGGGRERETIRQSHLHLTSFLLLWIKLDQQSVNNRKGFRCDNYSVIITVSVYYYTWERLTIITE